MATSRLTVKLTTANLVIGAVFVVLALALVSWLLPMVVGAQLTLTIAGAALGVLFWFLFMLSRQGAE